MLARVDARDIAHRLQLLPLQTVDEAKAPAGVPTEPGFYSWWQTRNAIPGVPATPHPEEPYGLLYVGIAPRDAVSAARLHSRLCHQHMGGNVSSSTFRFGLAALLSEHNGWKPRISASGKCRLVRDDNAALSTWQRTHLRLRWVIVPEPWRLEARVIRALKPPMNRVHNAHHAFYDEMGKARERFRNSAKHGDLN